jgi:hypothetical protein
MEYELPEATEENLKKAISTTRALTENLRRMNETMER